MFSFPLGLDHIHFGKSGALACYREMGWKSSFPCTSLMQKKWGTNSHCLVASEWEFKFSSPLGCTAMREWGTMN